MQNDDIGIFAGRFHAIHENRKERVFFAVRNHLECFAFAEGISARLIFAARERREQRNAFSLGFEVSFDAGRQFRGT